MVFCPDIDMKMDQWIHILYHTYNYSLEIEIYRRLEILAYIKIN